MSKSPWQNKNELYKLYVEQELSASAIGEKLGCSDVTVLNWLERHNISTRNPDPPTMTGDDHPRSVSKDELVKDYKQVADKLDKTPSQTEYNQLGNHSSMAIRTKFGSMGAIQEAAGLERLRKGRVVLECTVCGEEYSQKHSKKDNSRFCSRNCVGEWMSENMTGENNRYDYNQIQFICEWCGDSYSAVASRKNSTRFCSQKCLVEWRSREYSGENHPRWKGGKDYYRGSNWYRQRKKARERDNCECQHCGKKDADLDVHHIIPYRDFDDYEQANRLQNLITLCDSCHSHAEWGNIAIQSKIGTFSE